MWRLSAWNFVGSPHGFRSAEAAGLGLVYDAFGVPDRGPFGERAGQPSEDGSRVTAVGGKDAQPPGFALPDEPPGGDVPALLGLGQQRLEVVDGHVSGGLPGAAPTGSLPAGWALEDGAGALFTDVLLAETVTRRSQANLYEVGPDGENGAAERATAVPVASRRPVIFLQQRGHCLLRGAGSSGSACSVPRTIGSVSDLR